MSQENLLYIQIKQTISLSLTDNTTEEQVTSALKSGQFTVQKGLKEDRICAPSGRVLALINHKVGTGEYEVLPPSSLRTNELFVDRV